MADLERLFREAQMAEGAPESQPAMMGEDEEGDVCPCCGASCAKIKAATGGGKPEMEMESE